MLEQLEATLACFILSSIMVMLTVWIFVKLSRHDDWTEIQNGNLAVAMDLGGKVFGVGNIIRFAILTNHHPLDTLLWGSVGLVLMVLVYLAFEWLTPKMSIGQEIGKGNTAVGFMSMVFSLAMSFVIGASIA